MAIDDRTRAHVGEIIDRVHSFSCPEDRHEAALVAMRELLTVLDRYARPAELMVAVGHWRKAVDELIDEHKVG